MQSATKQKYIVAQGGGISLKNTILMNAQEVAEALGVSKASAYKMIHVWNEKLQKLGYTTVSGRIGRKYFQEQFYGLTEKEVI